MIQYPALHKWIRTNEEAVAISGDPHGVLNTANLEYLWAGLQNKYNDHPQPVIAKAAFLLDYLANKGHVFIEGNKRTALAATAAFLQMNGFRLEESESEATAQFVLEVAQGSKSLNQIQKWSRQKVKSMETQV